MKTLKHQFQPITNKNSRILILGSFPSVKSREESFYYMHPQNRFWSVLANVFKDTDFLEDDIQIKINTLNKYHIALYDVIEQCKIEGSSDSSIKDVVPTDIESLIKNTNIDKIFLNGKKAYDLFIKYNPSLKPKSTYLPSTSPANARYDLNKLIQYWINIIK